MKSPVKKKRAVKKVATQTKRNTVKAGSRGSAKTEAVFANAKLVMKTYIGTKLINGIPMSRSDYNKFRGWNVPEDENGKDKGYLVEYLDGGEPNTKQFKGYVSWSPKTQFENAYQETSGLNFGGAVEAAKMGFKVARAGWNGKGMWVIFVPGTKKAELREGTQYKIHLPKRKSIEILPHFDMFTINAQGRRAMLCGWLASQSDMNATDWCIVK